MSEKIEQIVEDELRKGSTFKEISEKIDRSDKVVLKIKNSLIEKGKLSEEDIRKGKEERKRIFLQTDPINKKIMEYTLAGLSQSETSQLLEISQVTVGVHIKEFKQFGLISQEEIEKARKHYLEEQKEDSLLREQVLTNLRKGIVKNDFAKQLGLTERGAYSIQQSLIEEGKITQEEIDEAVLQLGKITMRKQKVLELLKQGFNYTDTAIETGYCIVTIKKLKEQFVDNGQLNEKDYEEKKRIRKVEKQNNIGDIEESTDRIEEIILPMLMRGYDTTIICRKTQLATIDINRAVKRLIKSGKITKEQIDIARERYIEETEQKILFGLRKRI